MIARRRMVFFGRVQGVGFRMFCQSTAENMDVRGWVRNRPDSSVEMEAEASEDVLKELRRHLETAHPTARVDRVEESALAAREDPAEGFEIRS